MRRSWFRVAPASIIGVALVLAAFASSPTRASDSVPDSPLNFIGCPNVVQKGGNASSLFWFGAGAGITQPLGIVNSVPACSLGLQVPVCCSYDRSRVAVLQWDPTSLMPDPTTVALRSQEFILSSLQGSGRRFYFYPPVVVSALAGVAEPPRATTAIDFYAAEGQQPYAAVYDAADPSSAPAAFEYSGSGTRNPLPGSHPVTLHVACGGDGSTQSLRVVQSVMTTDKIADDNYELIQQFRVPQATRLSWVELAFQKTVWTQSPPGVVGIFDADGQVGPPSTLGPSLAESFFYNGYFLTSSWGANSTFDRQIILQPGHDYWLLARTLHSYPLRERVLTGSESSNFKSAIGPLFTRGAAGDVWEPVGGRALSFRLIGEPMTPVGIGPVPAPASFSLRVSPNPTQGMASIAWTGASGALRIEVLDERGRLINRTVASQGAAGRWTWRGRSDDGRAAKAGVYFVRASDRAGNVAVQRVVLIR